jgi:UDP-N-acetylmuramate dehydrogenase
MKNEAEYLSESPLKEFTTYRIGGPAEKLFIPQNFEQLQSILRRLIERKEKFYLIGGGSNLLIADQGLRGLVILMTECCKELKRSDFNIKCGASVLLQDLIGFAISEGFTGLERLAGIPGTLGGALAMNAGAYNAEISNHIISIEIFNEYGQKQVISKEEARFGYRRAPGLEGKLILGAEFEFTQRDPVGTAKTAQQILSLRRSKHPWQYPSAGSVFKRHPVGPAGKLIDQAGLKGMQIGGAQISQKHANFIINLGNARAIEVLALIRYIQRKLKDDLNIELELEQKLWGFTEEQLKNPDRFL